MRVVFIGAGNVATHLAQSFDKTHDVVQVYSRHIQNAISLANLLKQADATDNLNEVISDADIYVVSVKDDAISEIVGNIKVVSGLWVHTSGSVSLDVLSAKFERCGVFYPLQTFSRNVDVDMSEVPFFIEGIDDKTESLLIDVAKEISKRVYKANSLQRRSLHVAAVFGCNFVNYLWAQADEILKKSGYNFDILLPLINVTLDKAVKVSPSEGQTGPARRGDLKIMQSHEQMLSNDDAKLYRILSQCIMKKYNIDYEQN